MFEVDSEDRVKNKEEGWGEEESVRRSRRRVSERSSDQGRHVALLQSKHEAIEGKALRKALERNVFAREARRCGCGGGEEKHRKP